MKARLISLIDRIYPMGAPLPLGIYEIRSDPSLSIPYRLHLRIEPNWDSLLILNAKTVLHLNQTATEYAYGLLHHYSLKQMIKRMRGRYQIDRQKVEKDYIDFKQRLDALIQTPDLSPEIFLDFDRLDPHSSTLSAPLRIDCALTYKNPEKSDSKTTPSERAKRELSTDEWSAILQKAWEAGIPHVIFTGGEPCMRPDLPDLISISEKLGMVSGLLTSGYRLSEKDYLHLLLEKGLDHIMICLDPESDPSWEALRDLLAEDIFVTVHITLSKRIKQDPRQIISKLAGLGVKSISLSADNESFADKLKELQNLVAELGMTFVWDLPVPYSKTNPVTNDYLSTKDQKSGAGRTWIYVEPDGDVTPEQKSTYVVGNLVDDGWDKIKENLLKI